MNRRVALNTGQNHQAAVATWVRKRLADRGGAVFDDGTGGHKPRQIGCLLAVGVGLGKTWEALAAVALILDKRAWRSRRQRTRRVDRRQVPRTRRREAHVLVLVPPGLVAKWSSELRNPDGFQARLQEWAARGSRSFVAGTLAPERCFELRRRGDLDVLPRGGLKHGRYVLPPGVYVCNWNVFLGPGGPGRNRVTALRNQRWEAVVVDEAHHGRARKALGRLRHPSFRLLLTATPFQLDMTELHGLTKHLVEADAGTHRVLQRGAVRAYAKAADRAFDGGAAPTPAERRGAEKVLAQLVACSRVRRQTRRHFTIDRDGKENRVSSPSALDGEGLAGVFDLGVHPSVPFKRWYLERRLDLAREETADRPRHVSMELRKLLSVRTRAPAQPKLDGLRRWARQQFVDDLAATLVDGAPRKLLVFTHLKTRVVGPIKQALQEELSAAYRQISRTTAWKEARGRAPQALKKMMDAVRGGAAQDAAFAQQLARVEKAFQNSLFFDLLGKPAFARRAERELLRFVDSRKRDSADGAKDQSDAAWYARQGRTRRRADRAVLAAISKMPLAATFTGDHTRVERDALAEAFKTALAPWILVATNVGSEGIDLHRYCRHLVHFDLEWNPARMEQREGRIDRLGRVLKEPARIYYLLVRDTYDERMFHQLIARQRWHAVLLGRKARQLSEEEVPEARLITEKEAEDMSLDLDPRNSSRGPRRRKRERSS